MIKVSLSNVPTRTVGVFASTRNALRTSINSIDNTLSRIIEFNKLTRPNSRFLIVDKSKSKAMLYEGDRVINSFDVGVGETIGDSLNSVSYDYATKTFSLSGRTTPSGEFKTASLPNVCENKSDYIKNGDVNAILLNGVMHPANYNQNTSLALHQLPNKTYNERLQLLNNLSGRKSISTGCINFRVEDFKSLADSLPNGTPVYILPEEVSNSIVLTELPNGKLWFKTQYKDTERANALELAIKKYFNLP